MHLSRQTFDGYRLRRVQQLLFVDAAINSQSATSIHLTAVHRRLPHCKQKVVEYSTKLGGPPYIPLGGIYKSDSKPPYCISSVEYSMHQRRQDIVQCTAPPTSGSVCSEMPAALPGFLLRGATAWSPCPPLPLPYHNPQRGDSEVLLRDFC
jgi:hypothetical protein